MPDCTHLADAIAYALKVEMNWSDRRHRDTAGAGASHAAAPHFVGRTIDAAPHLLEQSYRLRYQVYCLERKFLRAEDYPEGLEHDEFDRHSIHVGAVDAPANWREQRAR